VNKVKTVAVCLIWACALAIPAHATTIVVTNTSDSGPGSLRQGLMDANDGDTIDATGISGVITLTTGELAVDKSVTINGASADVLAIDGNTTSRVFNIGFPSQTVTISGLTIRNAQGNFGGGIFISNAPTATIINCTVSGSRAGFGGGIFSDAALLTIANTTISGNIASEGGGIYNNGTVTITNSTFSDNSAQSVGGAMFNDKGTMRVTNSTMSNNSAFSGGGILNLGTLEIGNTILKTGASGGNILNKSGTVTSLGYNLSNDDGGGFLTGPGDQINTDPLLGPLQDNGGSTFTHELLSGSPAIDAGDPNFTPPPFFDQRGPGFDRVVNSRIDIGSFEVQTQTVAIQLRASGRKVGGINTVRLTWSGATSNNIDVYWNSVLLTTVPNTGTYTDSTGDTGRARYTYKVCEAGTSSCSNDVTVRFRH